MSADLTPLSPAFADVLAQIHARCFDHPWQAADFTALLNLPTTQGLIIPEGFILCSATVDEMEILTFCILTENRKAGKGSFLLDCVQLYAQENTIPTVFLEVAADNGPALSLYQKKGFSHFATRPKYYHHTTDALCFKWTWQK